MIQNSFTPFHQQYKSSERMFLDLSNLKQQKISDLFAEWTTSVIMKCGWFCHPFHTCGVENFWSCRIRIASKDVCWWRSFPLRALIPAGVINFGSKLE